MERRAAIFVATPAYAGQVTMNYFMSSIRAMSVLLSNRIEILFNLKAGDGLIGRTRAQMVNDFLQTDATHLMFIDSDIGYDPQDIILMLDAEQDVVCGIYRKRQPTVAFPFCPLEQKEVPMIRGAMEIKYGPTGFMLFRRAVIERMIAAYPERRCMIDDGGWYNQTNLDSYDFFPTPIDENGMFLSEDYGFCRLFRQIGGKIHMMPHISLIHTGPCDFSGETVADTLYKFAPQPEADIVKGTRKMLEDVVEKGTQKACAGVCA